MKNDFDSDYMLYIHANRKIISDFDDNCNEICFNCEIEKALVLLTSWKVRLLQDRYLLIDPIILLQVIRKSNVDVPVSYALSDEYTCYSIIVTLSWDWASYLISNTSKDMFSVNSGNGLAWFIQVYMIDSHRRMQGCFTLGSIRSQ